METSRFVWDRTCRIAWLLGLATASVALGFAHVLRGTTHLATAVYPDDAFYYMQIAWNYVHSGTPSFDGIHQTNGFHPLWLLLESILSLAVSSKEQLPAAVMLLSSGVLAACYIPIYYIGRRLGSEASLYWLSSLWFAYSVSSGAFTQGMENTVVALALFHNIAVSLHLAQERAKPLPLSIESATLALPAALLIWTRVDSGLYIVGIWTFLWQFAPNRRTALAAAGVLVTLSLALYGALMMRWGHSPVSVAGLVKFAGPPTGSADAIMRLRYLAKSLGFRASITTLIQLGLVLSSILRWKAREMRDVSALRISLMMAALAHMFLVLLLQRSGASWYFSGLYVTLVFFLGSAIPRGRAAVYGCYAVACAGAIFAILTAARPDPKLHTMTARYELARWADSNLPSSAILASWNAGQIGFYARRPTINLDGLVNTQEYARTVLTGRIPLLSYLRRERVSYVIDYRDYSSDSALSRLPVIKRIPRSPHLGASPLIVWKVDSDPVH